MANHWSSPATPSTPPPINAGGAAVYGNAALAQSTSLTDQTEYTPVARAIADIGYNGTVDTSTALYNVFNTNNPRSVITVNGSVFYISGQGVKGDTTRACSSPRDGASAATAVDDTNDTRDVEIYNGTLYLSQNSSHSPAPRTSPASATCPRGAATPTILSGINLTDHPHRGAGKQCECRRRGHQRGAEPRATISSPTPPPCMWPIAATPKPARWATAVCRNGR